MNTIETVADMRAAATGWRAKGKTIALVPTMGALHAGQEALIRAAVRQADVVVVSIFVNPFQFSPNEVVANYPRSLAEDLKLCAAAGAQFVFTPAIEEIYPRGYSTFVTEDFTGKPLDGVSRPTHFRGVATIMAKLFNIVHPTHAYFGQKTAQRAAVVRKMTADLGFPVEIVVVPTARDEDGLASGVRNREFTATQRQEALSLSKALRKAREMSDSGVRSPDRIIAEVTHILGDHRRVRIIYVSIVDGVTMEPAREVVPGKSLLTIAAWVDEIRVVDNTPL
jgi:pantoate--beta-alanine ligase